MATMNGLPLVRSLPVLLLALITAQPTVASAGDPGLAPNPASAAEPSPVQDDAARSRPQRPRAPRGLRVDSTVRFLDDTMTPLHRLVCTWIGDDRQRFELIAGGGAGTRLIMTHLEGRVFRRSGARDAAPALEGKNRANELRGMVLRRAAVDFPAGLTWVETEGRVRAEIPTAGSLIAEVDDQGRPSRIRSFDPEGVEYEGFDTFEWGDAPWPGAPQVPHSLRLTFRDRGIWSEQIDSVEVRLQFIDEYFLPPDQRRGAQSEVEGQLVNQRVDIVPAWELRAPLESARWDAIRSEVGQLHGRASQQLGRRAANLLPFLYVELDGEGRPTHGIVQVRGVLDPAPEGWVPNPGGVGIQSPVPEAETLTGGHLRRLAALGPKGSWAASARIQIQPKREDGSVFGLLTLRLELPEPEEGTPPPEGPGSSGR